MTVFQGRNTMLDFQQHRKNFFDRLPPSSISIIPSAKEKNRNGDVSFKFYQDSNFYYLTGFNEPESVAVLIKDTNNRCKYILFNRSNKPENITWVGQFAGQEGAIIDFHADQAYPIETFTDKLPELLLNNSVLVYDTASKATPLKIISQALAKAKQIRTQKLRSNEQNQESLTLPNQHIDVKPIIEQLRLIKNEGEIACLRKAAEVSAQAHRELMQTCQPGFNEGQLEAIHDGYVRSRNCKTLAYPSIVASGKNACILHYEENDRHINNGDLVLVDAAGEHSYYAADITRTFPANGKFSTEQKLIYNIVLQAQQAGIDATKPGISYSELKDIILQTLVGGLIKLNLLQGTIQDNINNKNYLEFYPHGFGHWIGLDVHDVGEYYPDGKPVILQAGMAFTIEPGIYIKPDNENVEERWRGIGVRIEDDILVTQQGCDVLSKAVPKQVDDIEKLMKKQHATIFTPQFKARQLKPSPICPHQTNDIDNAIAVLETELNLLKAQKQTTVAPLRKETTKLTT